MALASCLFVTTSASNRSSPNLCPFFAIISVPHNQNTKYFPGKLILKIVFLSFFFPIICLICYNVQKNAGHKSQEKSYYMIEMFYEPIFHFISPKFLMILLIILRQPKPKIFFRQTREYHAQICAICNLQVSKFYHNKYG